MPDWTYQPLRGVAEAMLGRRRSRLAALRALAAIGSVGGGMLVARTFGHRDPPPSLAETVAGTLA